jgi:hypothetical protein
MFRPFQIIFRELVGFLLKWCSVWRGMLDCKQSTYLSTQSTTHTHHTLCCQITTNNFYNVKNFKFSDFNKEPTSSLKMI